MHAVFSSSTYLLFVVVVVVVFTCCLRSTRLLHYLTHFQIFVCFCWHHQIAAAFRSPVMYSNLFVIFAALPWPRQVNPVFSSLSSWFTPHPGLQTDAVCIGQR